MGIVNNIVLDSEGNKYLNLGDAQKIDESQIKGVVVFKGVIISTIARVVNNAYGFYFLLFVPLSILIFLEILDISEERKKMRGN